MRGIAAVFSFRLGGQPVDAAELTRIASLDDRPAAGVGGAWFGLGGRIGLVHRQSPAGGPEQQSGQPMAAEDGLYQIVFDGAIYNAGELRAGLESQGDRCRTGSDAEMVLRLYMNRGASMVTALRGMFAFAIWDGRRGGLLLSRDHFGIKPLYLHDDGHTLRVASRVKALLAGGGIANSTEAAGKVGFYLWGSVPEPYTLYRDVFSLPAGHTLWVDEQGARTPEKYFHLVDELEAAAESPPARGTARQALSESLRVSVAAHAVSTEPARVLLSGGLGSAAIIGLAAEAGGSVEALTLAFADDKDDRRDDISLAGLAAKHYACRHRVVSLSAQDIFSAQQSILAAMDQPNIDGVLAFLCARKCAEMGWTVVSSGLGGDELLDGGQSFRPSPRTIQLARLPAVVPGLGRVFRLVSAPLLRRFGKEKYAGLLEYGGSFGGAYLLRRGLFAPWELPGLMDPDLVREGWQRLQSIAHLNGLVDGLVSNRGKWSALELSFHLRTQSLPALDWAGAANSVQIRTPLIDVGVFRALAPYIASRQPPRKSDLANVPKRPLPQALREQSGSARQARLQHCLGEIGEGGARDAGFPEENGLRRWAQVVAGEYPGQPGAAAVQVYGIFSDAFESCGGIARFNMNFMQALCALPQVGGFDVVMRHLPQRHPSLPFKLSLRAAQGSSLRRFVSHWLRSFGTASPALVICGHINLLPLAAAMAWYRKVPLWCILHGVDAWQPNHRKMVNRLLARVDRYLIVSNYTRERFLSWAAVEPQRCSILENAYDPQLWWPGPRSPGLEQRYGLSGKKVILTVARLASDERYKGHDQIIELLVELSLERPDLRYLIVGDGDDRERLQQKSLQLGLKQQVIFAGYVPDAEKADYYRLADVFAMPGTGEGFGIVYLEAMACGIPVIGSRVDGSRDALRDGVLGRLITPGHPGQLRAALLGAIETGTGGVPDGLQQFDLAAMRRRLEELLAEQCARAPGQ